MPVVVETLKIRVKGLNTSPLWPEATWAIEVLAGTVGLEPTTERLTAVCSTIELRTHLKWFLENLNSVYACITSPGPWNIYDRLLKEEFATSYFPGLRRFKI